MIFRYNYITCLRIPHHHSLLNFSVELSKEIVNFLPKKQNYSGLFQQHFSSALYVSSQLLAVYQSRHQHPLWRLPAAGCVKLLLLLLHHIPQVHPLPLHLRSSLWQALLHPPPLHCRLTRKIFPSPIMSTTGELESLDQ